MATRPKTPGNFYCIPSGSPTSLSARAALSNATVSARAMRSMIKKYQKRTTIPGVPNSVAQAYAFAQRSTDGFHSFDPPFTRVNLKLIEKTFKKESSGKLSTNFLNQMSKEAFPAVDAIQTVKGSKVNARYLKKLNNGFSLVQSAGAIPDLYPKGSKFKLGDGVWCVLYITLQSGKYVVLVHNKSLTEGQMSSVLRGAKPRQGKGNKPRIDVSSIKSILFRGTEISVFVCPANDLSATKRKNGNSYKYFLYKGQGIPTPVAAADLLVPARMVSSLSFTASVNPVEGYGPEFKGVRPPGTPKDFMVAYSAPSTIKGRGAFIQYINKLIDEDVKLINAAESKTLNSRSMRIPSRLLIDSEVMFSVVARHTDTYEVPTLAYDRRPTSDGRANQSRLPNRPITTPPAGTLVNDAGPFGQERGVDSKGKSIVEGPHRPINRKFRILKRYDDRVGAVASVYREETTEPTLLDPPSPVAGSKLKEGHTKLKTWLSSNGLEAFDLLKVFSIAIYRVRALADGKYKPYIDFVTIAMMYEIQLGKNLLDAYADQPENVANNIIQANFRGYFPARDVQAPSRWGSIQIRDSMPLFGYNTENDVPNWPDNTVVSNKDLFLPQGNPSSADKLVYFGQEANPPAGLASFKNWVDPNVQKFGRSHTSNRNLVINMIAIHWGGSPGGYNAVDGNVFRSVHGGYKSTHFIVGHQGHVRQHADIGVTGWHIGWFNGPSIGIDTASPGFPSRQGRTFSSAQKQGFANIGYRIVNCPIFNGLGGAYVGPREMYESTYQLVSALSALTVSGRVDMPSEDKRFPGIFTDTQGKKAVYVASGIFDTNKYKWTNDKPPIDPVGVVPHMYTNRSRLDDIVAYIYMCLRSLGDTSAQAYSRLVLTLQGSIKNHTYDGKQLRYLVLSRS